jgi:hydrogenase maturation protein HypF
MEIEGESYVIDLFYTELPNAYPPMSQVENVETQEIPLKNDSAFTILKSTSDAQPDVLITPDIATCVACRDELLNPLNRRYHYPFINCTDCGPRLTILKEVPYDRANTSMACFPLCKTCRQEFEDPDNRRYHAEPNACADCGPQLKLLDRDGNDVSSKDPMSDIIETISNGQIAAIKGLGGFHLCVDACNSEAVNKLRKAKFREEKPFAAMVKDIMQAAELCEINEAEKELLLSPECPIVLLKKKKFSPIAKEVAQNMPCLGIMLPSTPIQHLLFESSFQALVMTSANKKDEPICIGNREAVKRLSSVADFFLTHNRDILVRNDDSITMVSSGKKIILRRSRGYVPSPVSLDKEYPEVLALGPYLKSTACIITKNRAYLSPHIGDLETPEARDFLQENLSLLKSISKTSPDIIACDMHPDYFSTALAKQLAPKTLIQVQHHHAHIVSCMAENKIFGNVIGIAMDGTGYGPDNTVWGGEFLVADEKDFIRAGHLKNLIIPGGESSIREIWRIALSLLRQTHPGSWKQLAKKLNICPADQDLDLFKTVLEKEINCFTTSSLGRLFDGVSCLIGMRNRVSFEGQAAMELESIAEPKNDKVLEFSINNENNTYILDLMPAIKDIIEIKRNRKDNNYLASAFHNTLISAFTKMAETIRTEKDLNRVVLSGGCFQNRILLEGCVNKMEEKGFEVITHSLVPTNDGGISLGQAVCAAEQLLNK